MKKYMYTCICMHVHTYIYIPVACYMYDAKAVFQPVYVCKCVGDGLFLCVFLHVCLAPMEFGYSLLCICIHIHVYVIL